MTQCLWIRKDKNIEEKVLLMIEMGEALLKKKEEIRDGGEWWGEWFNSNYDKTARRTVLNYMKLARIPFVRKYTRLGMERILKLERIGRGKKDPIGDVLTELGLNYQEQDTKSIQKNIDLIL